MILYDRINLTTFLNVEKKISVTDVDTLNFKLLSLKLRNKASAARELRARTHCLRAADLNRAWRTRYNVYGWYDVYDYMRTASTQW